MTEALTSERLGAFADFVKSGGAPDRKEGDSPSVVVPGTESSVHTPPFRLYQPLSEAAHEYKDWAEHPELRVYTYFRPLVEAADEYEAWAKNKDSRIYTGVSELDDALRGTAPGELTLITASAHSGKTLLATQVIQHNANRRLVLFTPDETRTLVLVKMVALLHGVGAEELELRLQQEDQEARRILRATASELLPTLAVESNPLSPNHMSAYLRECEDAWGGKVEGVFFDYAELLIGAGEDVASKMSALKAWGKREEVPLFVLHQSSRTKGADGAKVTMTSGAYGGEQQATHLIGVRRKKFELLAQQYDLKEKIAGATSEGKRGFYEDLLTTVEYDLRIHDHTITFSVLKNKRPPCHLVDDIDFSLDSKTGRVSPLRGGDLPPGYLRSARDALQQREMPF